MAIYDLLGDARRGQGDRAAIARRIVTLLRYNFLPPRNAVNVRGVWILVIPIVRGPEIAECNRKRIPAWWLLECGRLAEFVGAYDGQQTSLWRTPLRHGEVVIDDVAIFHVTDLPLGAEAIAFYTTAGTMPRDHVVVLN